MSSRGNRILILSSNFPPVEGGIAHFIHQVTAHLPADEVTVVALPTPGHEAFDSGLDFAVKRLSIPRQWKSSSRMFKLISPFYAAAARQYDDARYIVCDRAHHTLLLAARKLARRLGACVATFAHGTDVGRHQSKWYANAYNRLLQSVDVVFANSSVTAELVASTGVARSRIHVLNPPVDPEGYKVRQTPEAFRSRYSLQGRKTILSLGRLVERKGFDTVLRALPEVLREVPEAHYLIAGNGPDRARLEALTAELGLEEHVTFAGFVATEDLPDMFNAADVFAMVSRELEDKGDTEGFGIVYLEANLLGKPVVAGRSGGVVDAVEDGVSGLLVQPHDIHAVSGALIELLRDEARAAQLGEAGRRRVLERFTSAHAAAEFRRLLHEDCGAS